MRDINERYSSLLSLALKRKKYRPLNTIYPENYDKFLILKNDRLVRNYYIGSSEKSWYGELTII